MERVRSSYDEDNQKTHYMISRNKQPVKRDDCSSFQTSFNQLTGNTGDGDGLIIRGNPFIKLFNGHESSENLQLRFQLYELIWQHQYLKIQNILNHVNLDLFESLDRFIHGDENKHKLEVGFLQLSSNIANNVRILSQFNQYISEKNVHHRYKFITLSSKYCHNIKSGLREIVRQFLDDEPGQGQSTTTNTTATTTSATSSDISQGRSNYDMDIVQDWYELQHDPIQIILTIQDTNSINNQILNQIFKIIYSYKSSIPFKLILGISSNNVSNWINDNINQDIKILMTNYKFKALDNSNLGFKILDELFLKFNSEFELPLFLLDSKLSSILLTRFENSNNSIDMLISQIKLCYMIHFYQSPISILLENSFWNHQPHDLYLSSLRKLPSFKKFVEFELYNNNHKQVVKLLHDNQSIIHQFHHAKVQFNRYKLILINVINIIDVIQHDLHVVYQPKFTIYDLIVNGKFLNSLYLASIFKGIQSSLSFDNIKTNLNRLIDNYQIFIQINDDQTGEIHHDTYLQTFINQIANIQQGYAFLIAFQTYLNQELLFKSIDQYLFHEIFTLDGGDIHQTSKLPENIENLMINLIRPNLRSTIEQSLDNPAIYFKNELISVEKYQIYPTLPQLFSIYKQAPVNINIYDFFTTFQYSLNKQTIEKKLNKQFDELNWNQITYAWFIQNCHELMLLGFLKEKPKGDVLEKSTWIGV